MRRPIERVVNLLDPRLNQLHNIDVEEARRSRSWEVELLPASFRLT
jgi:hypothetical protein